MMRVVADDEWIEVEIRMDRGSIQVSHRRDDGTTVYIDDDDQFDRGLLARVLREAADTIEGRDVGRERR
jgi:hypothetical protein